MTGSIKQIDSIGFTVVLVWVDQGLDFLQEASWEENKDYTWIVKLNHSNQIFFPDYKMTAW